MEQKIPSEINTAANKDVLDFISRKSAHSDVGEALINAVKPLGDAQLFCPDYANYRYIVASTKCRVFAFASGMNSVAFRLNEPLYSRALSTGGEPVIELKNGWVCFKLFRNDWPEFDLIFWARKAYVFARE